MKNGFMAKGLAGLGQGLAIAGQMGYQSKLQGDLESQRAELMSKRDEVLQRYENERTDKEIGARATEGEANRAAQKEGFLTQKQSHLEGIQMQLDAKDNKIEFKDGVVFKNGAPDAELTERASSLVKQYGEKKTTDLLQNISGLVEKKVAKDYAEAFNMLKQKEGDGGLPKKQKDLDDRVKQLDSMIRFHLTGSNTFATMDPKTSATYDKMMKIAGDLVRKGSDPEVAKNKAVEAIERESKTKTPKNSGSNPKTQSFRERYGY